MDDTRDAINGQVGLLKESPSAEGLRTSSRLRFRLEHTHGRELLSDGEFNALLHVSQNPVVRLMNDVHFDCPANWVDLHGEVYLHPHCDRPWWPGMDAAQFAPSEDLSCRILADVRLLRLVRFAAMRMDDTQLEVAGWDCSSKCGQAC
jgi:hypothetical protein